MSARMPLLELVESILTDSPDAFDPTGVKEKVDERRTDGKETPIAFVTEALEELHRRGAILIRWYQGESLYQGFTPRVQYPR